MNYLKQHGTRSTPQRERIPGRADQVKNSAGGYGFEIDRWARLARFLVLGSEGGTYYASERKLTTENVACIHECLDEDAERFVKTIVSFSEGGRAPKNDPALFALACAISHTNPVARRAAEAALPRVARIGTHLYHFVAYAETMRGWGPLMRRAVANWYLQKPGDKLAYDVVKYRQRDDWSHRDLLRLAHPKTQVEPHRGIFQWVTHGLDETIEGIAAPANMIEGFEIARRVNTVECSIEMIRTYKLPREAIPTEHLRAPGVWMALLETGMPAGAMLRNLAVMTKNGTLDSQVARSVVEEKLGSAEALQRARIHPLAVLIALTTYLTGKNRGGRRGARTWNEISRATDGLDYGPKSWVIDLLDEAFYLAFASVEPTNKRTLIGLDVSSSMTQGSVAGSNLTPHAAAAAMCMIAVATEPECEVFGFATTPTQLPFSKRMRLSEAMAMTSRIAFGGTDCALPFKVARTDAAGSPDSFIVYTDNETWQGSPHPSQALAAYREASGKPARSAVVGMTATNFTIADPRDPGMMDFVGFDAAAPQIMNDFFRGAI